ncbi:hypothetical protein SPRG_02982 [Saprolegnia parasitica CBS 223.65]|uniref:Uncharacterized protein n=1 Tax=Saprolegnia parasitica (strain CBS 223.65) TaxID=695850 RepID=A0A067CTC2_SAPPC|nr:hypothetical protein SPRG_02982 [Saprolegnia parasitica CBS 223.65]KDO32505.1 hypothetical protein SPRG_02982 [Saprolegnia parasitica CBS 223.65]|eukprot:XP_012196954.1 hypothetical protein SPRG_02982 [Saprolegnia parasitica CBS 223.65]
MDVAEIHAVMLAANAPPPKDTTLKEIVCDFESKRYDELQFGLIQGQTQMDGRTLQFAPAYEDGYMRSTQEASRGRIRAVFLIGLLVYAGLMGHSWYLTPPSTLVLALDVGVALLAFGIGLGLTFAPRVDLERVTCGVFFIVASVLIAKKPLQRSHGPVLPLMLLLIPIFGITRMRFLTSCVLGISILLLYMVVQLFASVYVDGADAARDVMYQVFNYAIRVVGGMVSHYRQEVLRRRNYALELPFHGLIDGDATMLFVSSLSTSSLWHPWSLSFAHEELEAAFYRFWYLLDPFPFENVHDPALHRRVFSTVRYALLSVLLAQVLLAIQDAKLLPASIQDLAWCTRFGVVVPAYLLMAGVLYGLSHSFAAHSLQTAPRLTYAAYLKRSLLDHILLHAHGGYVRYAQWLAGLVVLLHIAAMATLVLVVYSNPESQRVTDLYFMGLLNALLFVHRSGFRVRFVYASTTTAMACALFIGVSAHYLQRRVWLPYACYCGAILLLGSVTSYEEEALRRSFFVLRSLRTSQFRQWRASVLKVQSWMRRRLQKKLQTLRQRHHASTTAPNPTADATSARLATATRVGVYGQFVQVLAEVL